MITQEPAAATRAKVDTAVAEGAVLLCGNDATGALYTPAVLEDIPPACSI
jgi:acyl-CoA reductase-like NAD-dependent aldehyde dehydrogenase